MLPREEILQEHLTICDELYALMLEEGKLLRCDGTISEENAVFKKRLLSRLNASVKQLKKINEEPKVEGIRLNELIKATQKKTMKILLLDRENEQLLLKQDFEKQKELTSMPASKRSALAAYAGVENDG